MDTPSIDDLPGESLAQMVDATARATSVRVFSLEAGFLPRRRLHVTLTPDGRIILYGPQHGGERVRHEWDRAAARWIPVSRRELRELRATVRRPAA